MNLKWRVGHVPSGKYRAFEIRGWPDANHADEAESAAIRLACADEYVPRNLKSGNHAPIFIYIAQWLTEEERGTRAAFIWRKLSEPAATLVEAKKRAQSAVDQHPEFLPEHLR